VKLKKFVSDNGGVTRDFHQIDPRLLQVRPDFNIRDLTTPAAREKLDILKAQIKAEGVLEPLEIEFDGETPWINEGHRRHIVVMELIEEGHDFKTIPCVQERQNIKADKRTLHMLMRSKEDYEPLEYAKGVDRMVNVYGWDKGALATALGFKSKGSIDQYLEMLGMTDAVKEQVAQGEVSATVALKVTRETRDARTDPEFAAELIRKAAEEQKRLGKRGRATPKAIERVKPKPAPKSDPKPEPAKTETPTPIMAPNAEVEPPTVRLNAQEIVGIAAAKIPSDEPAPLMPHPTDGAPPVHEQLQGAADRERGQTFSATMPFQNKGGVNEEPSQVTTRPPSPPSSFAPPSSAHDFDREMFAIVARLATIAEENCIGERADDEMVSVPAEVLKAADRAYRSRVSDELAA
jgi:hypothetical protein